MKTIYIGSTQTRIGKSALCMGLVSLMEKSGLKTGYMKPVGTYFDDVKGELVDRDARAFKELLGIDEPISEISPVRITQKMFNDTLEGKRHELLEPILKSFKNMSRGKDFMLLEGMKNIAHGIMFGLSDVHIASALNAQIVIMARYDENYFVDRILLYSNLVKSLGMKPMVLFYDIPPKIVTLVTEKVTPFLKKDGIESVGIVPHNPELHTLNVKELATSLDGKIIAGENVAGDTYVSDYIVGTMTSENALRYFRRTKNSAAVMSGDRAYMQAAALNSPIKALIITGNLEPSSALLVKAQEAGKPVILVKDDTQETIERFEHMLELVKITDSNKLKRFTGYLSEHIDIGDFLDRVS